MADNYLEKKMEDHRNGGPRRSKSAVKSVGGAIPDRLPACKVMFAGDVLSELSQAIMGRLVAAGARVAFTGCDFASGNALAQATGSLFVPVEGNDSDCDADSVVRREMCSRWGSVDAVVVAGSEIKTLPEADEQTRFILISGDGMQMPDRPDVVMLVPGGATQQDVAKWCVFLLLPAGRCVKNQRIILG